MKNKYCRRRNYKFPLFRPSDRSTKNSLLHVLTQFSLRTLVLVGLGLMLIQPAYSAVWDQYNLAPVSRIVGPHSIYKTNGNIVNANNVLSGQATAIVGNGSYITLDFGVEVGGIATLTFSNASDTAQSIGIAFTESPLYVGVNSDQSNGSGTPDGALTVAVPGASTYTMPLQYLRGGFRYMTIFLRSGGWVHLNNVSLNLSIDPERAVLNQYPNYFYSNDVMLNRVWYAGAYTFQTNIVRNNEGRAWPPANGLWDNDNIVGEYGNVVLTDAPKRDRTVWPGDMGIALPTGYAALFETVSSRNALQTLFNHQEASGELHYAGPPMNFGGSDTYHMWTLYGTHAYYFYTRDDSWLDGVWSQYKNGLNFILSKMNDGLLFVTGTNDWARENQGDKNIAANALLYGVLTGSAELADAQGDATLANDYRTRAANLKSRINAVLWDSQIGAYRDRPESTLYPQDGNSLAVWFDVIDDPAKGDSISNVLNENWNGIGSRGPEFTHGSGTPKISTFSSSMELMSHFASNNDERALEMIRMMWGYMLDAPQGTGSTFWEGFTSDGGSAYQGSFQSMAHAWGSGPTSALTFYTLGIKPTSTTGQRYDVVPHPGKLTHVEGNLTLAPGKVVFANYDVSSTCDTFSLRVDSSSHTGSLARVGIPRFGANHVINVDGAPVWDGSNFIGANGIGSVNQDEDYIYFNDVQPGDRTFNFSDGLGCPAPEMEWTFCADENESCSFTGTKRVRYGKRGQYLYRIVDGGVSCDSSTFGDDPINNVPKSCQVSDKLYSDCAAEGQICSFSGTKEIRFGANGQWATRVATNAITCDAATFGDPLADVVKRCEVRDIVNDGPTGYSFCASEGDLCHIAGTATVAYGANGNYAYLDSTDKVVCDNTQFGDSSFGAKKACFYKVADIPVGPEGYTYCAAENESCSFTGNASVAFGANGRFSYADATSIIGCDNNNFVDPISGVVKACFYKTLEDSTGGDEPSEDDTGSCSGVTVYVDGSSYATGAIVQNAGNQYQCLVGGWCTVGGPYEPGVGWAWNDAWTQTGACQ